MSLSRTNANRCIETEAEQRQRLQALLAAPV